MSEFIYTAKNNKGKRIAERIEAESLNHARQVLEDRDCTEINFISSEIYNEVLGLYDEKTRNDIKKVPVPFLREVGKAGFLHRNWLFLRHYWHYFLFLLAAGVMMCLGLDISFIWSPIFLILFLGIYNYYTIPAMLQTSAAKAINNTDWARTRKLGKMLSFASKVVPVNTPQFYVDLYYSYADTGEGNLAQGLARIKKYEDDTSVSKPLYHIYLSSIYAISNQYDDVIENQRLAMELSGNRADETIAYAIGLVRFGKRATEARNLMERAYDNELTESTNAFASYAMGIIEFEEKDFDKAEFHLLRAEQQLKETTNPILVAGFLEIIKAYLTLIYAKRGRFDDAERLYSEAKPYLVRHNEHDLINRCEKALA